MERSCSRCRHMKQRWQNIRTVLFSNSQREDWPHPCSDMLKQKSCCNQFNGAIRRMPRSPTISELPKKASGIREMHKSHTKSRIVKLSSGQEQRRGSLHYVPGKAIWS